MSSTGTRRVLSDALSVPLLPQLQVLRPDVLHAEMFTQVQVDMRVYLLPDRYLQQCMCIYSTLVKNALLRTGEAARYGTSLALPDVSKNLDFVGFGPSTHHQGTPGPSQEKTKLSKPTEKPYRSEIVQTRRGHRDS